MVQVTAKDNCQWLKSSMGFGDSLVQVAAKDNCQWLKSSMGFGDCLVQVAAKDNCQLLKSSMGLIMGLFDSSHCQRQLRHAEVDHPWGLETVWFKSLPKITANC